MPIDPSYSRTYLTTSNNHYQQIHNISNDSSVLAERQRRNERLIGYRSDAAKRRISPLLKVVATLPNRALPETETLHLSGSTASMASEEDDVNRLPDSSDEENAQDTIPNYASDEESRGTKRKAVPSKKPLNTKDINIDGARRSKRRKTSDEPPFSSTMPEKESKSVEEEDDFMLRAVQSQEHKQRKGFSQKYRSTQSSFSPPSSATQPKTERTKFKSISREATPVSEVRRSKRTKAQMTEISSSPSIPSSQQRPKSKLIESSPAEPEPVARAVFQAIENPDLDDEPTSRTTSASSKSAIFDKAKPDHTRRGSTSSLSSADSIIDYQLDPSQKAALMSEKTDLPTTQPLPPNHIICPSCRRQTSLRNLPNHDPKTNPNTLSLRQQTKFCYDHRIRDAQETWKQRGYPTIDWSTLPTSPSLQTHIKSLVPLIRRKSPSQYLSTIDAAISAARGNTSEINRVFDVTNVHHGYYGPRGAKIITNAIMDDADLQKVLSRQLRNDKVMRIAGLGRLTDCVLLPEVLMRMVQEDLVIGSKEEAGEQARKVLEESEEVGLLLCGDDDEVDGDGDGVEEEVEVDGV